MIDATELDFTDWLPELHSYYGEDFPEQAKFRACRAKWRFVGAASRTGKTYGAADNFVESIFEDLCILPFDDDKLYWCIAPTYDDCIAQKIELLRLIPKHAIDWDRQGNKEAFFDVSHGKGVLFLLGNIEIELRSADKPERLVARKVRGIWWTEIARSKVKAWANAYSRLSNYDDSWFIGDTSPYGRCWFYRDVWEKAMRGEFKGAECFTWTAEDSPYVSQATIDDAKDNLTKEMYEREFKASWAAFQGQIYTSWSRERNVVERCPFTDIKYRLISIDINTTVESPAAMGTFEVGGIYRDLQNKDRKRMHLAKEFYEVIGLDYERYAAAIAAEYQRCQAYGIGNTQVRIDPSAHRDFKKMIRAYGVPIKNAKNKVHDGIKTLGGAMVPKRVLGGVPGFTVDAKCRHFSDEVEGYAYRVSAAGVTSEEPDKTNPDHMLDVGRYAGMDTWTGFESAKQVR